jgi:hypothetical protein
MATTIKIKNGTSGAPSSLAQGELAININNGSLFFGTENSSLISSSFTFSHVTASGIIKAEHFYSTDDATIDDDLSVGGTIAVGDEIHHIGDVNTKIRFANGTMNFYADNEILLSLVEDDSQDKVIIGDGGDVDFQVKSNGDDNALYVEGDSDNVGIGTNDPGSKLTVHGHISSSGGNYIGNRRFNVSSTTDNNTQTGDIIYMGANPTGDGATTAGNIVYLDEDGEWQDALADGVTTSTNLLGIALGTNPVNDGVLLRGTYTLDHDVGNDQGVPLYLSDQVAGQATATIPDSDGDIVRIIGHNLGDDDEIWFNPSPDWVVLG